MTTKREKPTCRHCGSEDVTVDAAAKWDVDTQDWSVACVYDSDWHCSDCDREFKYATWVPVDGGPPTIEMTPGWYVVWYWVDPEHYTNKKFMDYEDALAFAKEHGFDEAKGPTEVMARLLQQPAAPYLED